MATQKFKSSLTNEDAKLLRIAVYLANLENPTPQQEKNLLKIMRRSPYVKSSIGLYL